jgi:hypothetical protein
MNSNSKSNSNSKNNNNKDNNSKVSPIGLILSYKDELPINLYDKLVDHVKQQDKLNDFLKYDERQLEVYFLEEITNIFEQIIRNACNVHNVGIEGLKDFLADNWVNLRFDELTQLVITYVYNHSPLTKQTKTRGIKQFKKLQQEFSKDIIDNWFAIILHDSLTS